MTYKTDSARCGAGKTTAIVNKVNKYFTPLKEGVIIIQPSIIAINETAAKIPGSIAIHSENAANVGEEVHKHIYGEGKVIIMTHQAFLMLDIVLPQWHLIIDEEINPLTVHKLNLCDTADKLNLSDYYTFRDSEYDNYKIVEAKDEAHLSKMAESNDDVMKLFKTLNECIISQYHDTYITTEMCEKFVDADGMLFAHTLLRKNKFEHFKSVEFYGARFEDSFLSNILGLECNVTRAFEKHSNKNVTIHSGMSKWSKNANMYHADKKQVFVDYIKNSVGNKQAIYVDNNDQNYLGNNDNFERINHNPHGINKYNKITEVAVLSAIIPHNATVKFLKEVCGQDDVSIKRHFMASLSYQIVMRTALRNADNTSHVNMYILDADVASFLAFEYFDDAYITVVKGTEIERKMAVAPLTSNDRHKATNIRKMYNEAQHLSTRELMSMLIWDYTSYRGKLYNEAQQVLDVENKSIIDLLEIKDINDKVIIKATAKSPATQVSNNTTRTCGTCTTQIERNTTKSVVLTQEEVLQRMRELNHSKI